MKSGTWRTVPLWSLASETRVSVEPYELGDRVAHYSIPAVDATGTAQVEATDSIKSAKLRLHGGEVLVSKLNPRKSRVVIVAESTLPIVSSTEFVGLTPGRDLELRFLAYFLQSESTRQTLDSQVQSVTRSHQRVAPEDITHLLMALPSLHEQRRVADFLDAETAHIELLSELRMKQQAMLRERHEAEYFSVISAIDAPWTQLRRLDARVTTGPFGTQFSASDYKPHGIPMINTAHIRDGIITPDPHHAVSRETANRLSRHRLKTGDIVIARKRHLGRSALVQEYQEGWICGSDSITLTIPSTRVIPEFTACLLRSMHIRSQLLKNSLAATIPNLNEENLLSLQIPYAPLSDQRKVVTHLEQIDASMANLSGAMNRQMALLAERRQVLITAAVTGQFDVTTASGRNVAEGVTV
ncbi:restriction endonuclease subunit S [Streptomyces sp. NPDC003247]|uniref:restriction endonuclease subunit S n=1 Tax=Streptomyces sp. NPDC003247 TaxID=3364677 RepID=UPI0036A2CD52